MIKAFVSQFRCWHISAICFQMRLSIRETFPGTPVHSVRVSWFNEMPLFRVYAMKRHSWSQGAPFLHGDLCPTRLLAECLLKCSGHGHCDPITKRCICSQLWMENLIQRYIQDGESNCGESWCGGFGWGAFRQIILNCQKDLPSFAAVNSTLFSPEAKWTSSRGDGLRSSHSSPWGCV